MNFFDWFNNVLDKLDKRSVSIKKTIDFLETKKDPIIDAIIQTPPISNGNSIEGNKRFPEKVIVAINMVATIVTA